MPFDFTLDSLQNVNAVADAVSMPGSGGAGLRTSWSVDPNPKSTLTTYTLSEAMQGFATYKPKGATYDLFNQDLSRELEGIRGEKNPGFEFREDRRLSPYDIFEGEPSKNQLTGVATTTTAAVNAQTNSVTSGVFTAGNPPADIPRGPFPLRIVRKPGGNGYVVVKSDVAPVQISENQIARLLAAAGCARGDRIAFLIAVTLRESGGVANVAGIDKNGGMGVGLWQITDFWPAKRGDGNTYRAEDMTDPWTNVMDAMRISKNGNNMSPWNLSGQWQREDGSHLRKVDISIGQRVAKEAGVY